MSDTTNNETENSTVEPAKNELPEWAQSKIAEANAEAAKYRVEKKDAVEAAKQEVTTEFEAKIAALEEQIELEKQEAGNSRTEVQKIKAALAAGVASDKVLSFADLLKGENEEELTSHAEEVKKLFVTDEANTKSRATDHSQGSGSGSVTPLNGDPLLQKVMSVVNR